MLAWLLWGILGAFVLLSVFILVQFIVIPARNPVRKLKGPPYKGRIFGSHLGIVLEQVEPMTGHT
jgi:hypothetical protein